MKINPDIVIVIFGGDWFECPYSGSRCCNWVSDLSYLNDVITSRGVCNHYRISK